MHITIKNVRAIEILDSRGDPTLEVTVELANGMKASASVPSGASTGAFEAYELRDGDQKRYGGKGVLKAIANVEQIIAPELRGADVSDQRRIDDMLIALDGTENKSKLGANAILGVSLATARLAALVEHTPLYKYLRALAKHEGSAEFRLPIPFVNVINGGKHASSNLDLQEFWVVPHGPGTFAERLRAGSEVFHALGALLKDHGKDTDLGNEGGYAPDFSSHDEVFGLLIKSIVRAGYGAGTQVSLGLDAGSSVFYDPEHNRYSLALEHAEYSSDEMIAYFIRLFEKYPFAAAEDPLAEEDWIAWQKLTAQCAARFKQLKLVGDDLFVTNPSRLQQGIDRACANTILIKPNQIGTLSETLECIALAKQHRYATVISHRSGETTDTFIADLAVAVNADYIKTGSTARGERTAKYNRLLEIEQEVHAGK